MDKPDGLVTISCEEDNDKYTFSISDNGPGIDPQHHDKIFKIFQKLHNRTDIDSTGVGLSIVKKNRGKERWRNLGRIRTRPGQHL